MREGQKRVNVYIPDDLYSRVLNSEYNMTEAIIAGLNKFFETDRKDFDSEVYTSKEDSTTLNTEVVISLKNQIKNLEEKLSKAPDPVELAKVHTRYEEIEKHNQTLKAELEKAERDKEDLKTTYNKLQDTHNNYMAQMQTLIKQKSIEAPGAKKPWWRFW